MSTPLPSETDRSDLTWGEVCGFLEGFVLSREVIKLSVRLTEGEFTDKHGTMELVGRLTGGAEATHEPGRYYFIDWPDIGTHIGILGLRRWAFAPGRLSAVDGTDYFVLSIPQGDLTYLIGDTNLSNWTGVPAEARSRNRAEALRSIPRRAGWPDENEIRHGLPHDISRTGFNMREAIGYLKALGVCDEPVSISVTDRDDPSKNLEVTGYLSGGGFVGDYSKRYFYVDWPDRDGWLDKKESNRIATVTLPDVAAEGSIVTKDGNATFTLEIEAGSRTLRITDARSAQEPNQA